MTVPPELIATVAGIIVGSAIGLAFHFSVPFHDAVVPYLPSALK